MEDAVLVEVDPAAVLRRQESVTFIRQNLSDTRHVERHVTLHVTALAASVVLQSPAGGFKGIVDRWAEILVSNPSLKAFLGLCFTQSSQARVKTRCALHDDLFSRHFYIDANVIRASLPMVTMGQFDRYVTAHYAIEKSIELVRFGTDPFLDCG
jgi:hypothetical protein